MCDLVGDEIGCVWLVVVWFGWFVFVCVGCWFVMFFLYCCGKYWLFCLFVCGLVVFGGIWLYCVWLFWSDKEIV